ncbi:MAG: L,D-transpeptidase family protein [Novosphingobium sp.]
MIHLASALFAVLALAALALLLVPGWLGLGSTAIPAAKAAAPAALVKRPATPAVVLPPAVSDVLRSGVLIVISKHSQQMFVFKNGQPWAVSPVSTGKRGHATPAGVFPILQKAVRHRSNLYSNAPMPYMQRLTWSGIAIHAGRLPGYPASHGCVRLPHAFARALFVLTRASATTVVITNDRLTSNGQARTLALNTPMPHLPVLGAPQPQETQLTKAPAAAQPRIEALPLDPVQLAAGGQTIQLAAAATPDEANAMWIRMIAVHPELARYQKAVIPAVVGSRKVYRLRATAPGAHSFCTSLKQRGGACFNVS